jgi:MAP/microtubule affinity-regulating kinase
MHEIALLVHGDIKLENVLVDEMGVCRIADFGMTRGIGELDEDCDLTQEQNRETLHPNGVVVHRAASLNLPPSGKSSGTKPRPSTTRHRNSTNSTQASHVTQTFQPGSLPYASPELLQPHCLTHPAQDVWAVGILLFTLFTGRLPFMDSYEPRLTMKIMKGVYDVPPGIGRGAERILEGCLDPSLPTRWTIARVDELAWSIGSGTEGDDVTPSESDEEFESCPASASSSMASASHSRSHSRPPEPSFPESPEWQNEDRRSFPSLEVASRRSSSRIKRSLSRAPVTRRRSSSRIVMGHSRRHSRDPSPSLPERNIGSSSGGMSSGLSLRSSFQGAPLILSQFFERGRRRQKAQSGSSSRSPSPSLRTPIDSRSASIVMSRDSDDAEYELPRGRKLHGRCFRPLRSDQDMTTELDVLVEVPSIPGSAISPTFKEAGVCLSRNQSKCARDHRSEAFHPGKRPVSSPPAVRSSLLVTKVDASATFVGPHHRPKSAGAESFLDSTKLPSALTRSRSAGPWRGVISSPATT